MKPAHCFIIILLGVFQNTFAQEWEVVSSPPQFLSHHSFGFSLDGMGYLVTGASGNDQSARDDFYQYDPNTDNWTQLNDFETPRAFGIGDTHDGKAYFGFGTDVFEYHNDLWAYDSQTSTWEELSSCPCTARIHPALVAINGKVYMGLGGGSGENLGDWWEYDIETDSWQEKASFPGPNRHHPYQFGIGDYVYVGLGHGNDIYNDLYRYDPATDSWTEMASLPGEARVAGTQFSHNGKGYVLSGEGDDHGPMETGEFWMYDPSINDWELLTEHPGTSRWAPASFIIDDEIYLINGMVRDFSNSNFLYQDVTYKFTLDASSSISETENSEVKVYPNPTQNLLTVELAGAEHSTVSLLNSLGQSVLELTEKEQREDKVILNLSSLETGLYYLKVGEFTTKVQKM